MGSRNSASKVLWETYGNSKITTGQIVSTTCKHPVLCGWKWQPQPGTLSLPRLGCSHQELMGPGEESTYSGQPLSHLYTETQGPNTTNAGGFPDQHLFSQSHTTYHETKSLKAFGGTTPEAPTAPCNHTVGQVHVSHAQTDLGGDGGFTLRDTGGQAFSLSLKFPNTR